ncbi:hypothetical protein BKA62DRAFT_716245 [Auriculariales sp. MPI-PUGE-AT-0066]|nr:hypothetical protein BKA62DRAFT_716245 [Auriculariales sp. MPI-PUGE-AT-0066]
MPGLLNLPSELLEDLVEWVILRETPAPMSVDEAAAERAEAPVFSTLYDCKVITERRAIISNSTALLGTNHFISDITKQAIRRLRGRPQGLPYKLDVLLVGESEIWTTWLHVPSLEHRIDRVDVNTFLRRGPALDAMLNNRVKPDGELSVGRINLNITTLNPKIMAPDELRDDWRQVRREVRYRNWNLDISDADPGPPPDAATQLLYDLCMKPRWLAKILLKGYGIEGMLAMIEPHYGAILHERIGTMTVLIDGEFDVEYAIGEMFAQLVVPQRDVNAFYAGPSDHWSQYPREERPLRFAEWWNLAFQKRTRLGFPVGSATEANTPWPQGHRPAGRQA